MWLPRPLAGSISGLHQGLMLVQIAWLFAEAPHTRNLSRLHSGSAAAQEGVEGEASGFGDSQYLLLSRERVSCHIPGA